MGKFDSLGLGELASRLEAAEADLVVMCREVERVNSELSLAKSIITAMVVAPANPMQRGLAAGLVTHRDMG